MVSSAHHSENPLGASAAEAYQTLLTSFAQAFWETDAQGQTMGDSPTWRAYTGQTQQQLRDEGWAATLHPDDRGWVLQQWQQAVRDQTFFSAEFRLQSPDDSWRWTCAHALPIRNADGSVRNWLGANIDITDRKRPEERQVFLLQLSDALRSLTDAGDIRNTAVRLLAEHVGADQAHYYEISVDGWATTAGGYPAEGTAVPRRMHIADFGQPWLEAYNTNQFFIVADVRTDARLSEQARQAWYTFGFGSGMGVPLIKDGRLSAVLTLNTSGPRAWTAEEVWLLRDVAERTWATVDRACADESRRMSEERQRAILESARDYAIFSTDLDRRVRSWNTGAQAVLGYTEEAILGQVADIVFTPQDRAAGVPNREAETAISQGRADNERWYIRRDGSRFYGSGVTTPLLDATGQVIGLLKVMRDLTAQKQAEDALQAASRHKDEFLAMLSHELRNPVATLNNTLLLLQPPGGHDPALPLEQAITLMSREVAHLTRMVDDLLDVNRIGRGKIQLQQQPLDLGELLRHALEAARPASVSQKQVLTLALPTNPVRVTGDPTRLTQVVRNLLSNAAKHTPPGGLIEVVLEGGTEAVIRVRDTGVGIAPNQLEAIFNVFFQGSTSLDRPHGGLGLGLTVVRQLVEAHGGHVIAQSAGPGQGSEFIVTLPRLPDRSSPAPSVSTPTGGQRLLVVDDNADLATTTAMLLRARQYDAHTRFSGPDALAAVEQLRPDVILLDLGMPGLNGYETARQLRALPWGKHGLIVALTGYGQPDDIQRTQQAGFDGHLVKPIDLNALTDLLARLTRSTPER